MEKFYNLGEIKALIRQEIGQKEQMIRATKQSGIDQEKIERIVIGFTAEITAYQNVLTLLSKLQS